MKVDVTGEGAEKVYDAGSIYVLPGLYRVEEITQEVCTIRRLPATHECLGFRFHQSAPSNWEVGCTVEVRLNPSSPTGRTIQRPERWEEESRQTSEKSK